MKQSPQFKSRYAAVNRWMEALHFLPKAAGYVSSFFLFSSVVLIIVEIISRQITGRSIRGVYEMSGWLMAMITWTALGYTTKQQGHVQVRLIIDRIPLKVRRIVDVILYGIGTAAIFYLVVAMWDMLEFYHQRGQVGLEIRLQIFWVYLMCFIGGCVMLISFVLKFWESILIALHIIEAPPDSPDDEPQPSASQSNEAD